MSPVDYIEAVAKFPGSGLSADVKNGQQNPLSVVLRNGAASDITLVAASASYHDVDRHWKLLRNASEHRYLTPVLAHSNVSLPFSVYADFKPREVGLTVWVDVLDAGQQPHRLTAFNSTVNVVEPPTSIYADPSLLFLYALLALPLVYLASLLYRSFAPSSSASGTSSRRTSKPPPVVVVPARTSEKGYPASAKPYDDEWIPAVNLPSKRRPAAAATTMTTSGDELASGGEGKQGGGGGKAGKVRRK